MSPRAAHTVSAPRAAHTVSVCQTGCITARQLPGGALKEHIGKEGGLQHGIQKGPTDILKTVPSPFAFNSWTGARLQIVTFRRAS